MVFWRGLGGKIRLGKLKKKRAKNICLISYCVVCLICLFGYTQKSFQGHATLYFSAKLTICVVWWLHPIPFPYWFDCFCFTVDGFNKSPLQRAKKRK